MTLDYSKPIRVKVGGVWRPAWSSRLMQRFPSPVIWIVTYVGDNGQRVSCEAGDLGAGCVENVEDRSMTDDELAKACEEVLRLRAKAKSGELLTHDDVETVVCAAPHFAAEVLRLAAENAALRARVASGATTIDGVNVRPGMKVYRLSAEGNPVEWTVPAADLTWAFNPCSVERVATRKSYSTPAAALAAATEVQP